MNPIQLARENPTRLVRLFRQTERSTRRIPGDLLPIACQLLRFATDGLVMARGCTRIAFEFEGYRSHAVFQIAAMVDSRGEFILDMDRVQKWKPDDEVRLGDLLEKAAEVFLNGHLPKWREAEGADGQLSLTISTGLDGAIVLVPRGHAAVRTMTERTVTFPSRT